MDAVRRRGLINGGIAAAITFVIGSAIVATSSNRLEEPPAAIASPTPSASPTPVCAPSWETVPSANRSGTPVTLLGVSAIAAAEGWAVGSAGDPTQPSQVEIQRWDGSAWTRVEAPSPGSFVNELRAVDASEPNDIWAVGRTSSGFVERPLVLRFDGTVWSQVEVPDEIEGALNDVAAISPSDVWAVGYVGDPFASLERALVLHWDGLAWAVVDVQAAIGGGKAMLRGVDAVSPTDLWAVGYQQRRPLILRFDGRSWSRSDTEVAGELSAVAAFATSEVWAVGTPIQRYNGIAWTESAVIPRDTSLADVAAIGGTDLWSVGSRPVGAEGAVRAAVVRWDGERWRFVDGPAVGGSDALAAVDALPDGTLMAVGYRDTLQGRRSLAARGLTCPSLG